MGTDQPSIRDRDRAAEWDSVRREGHHRHARPRHRVRLGDLPRSRGGGEPPPTKKKKKTPSEYGSAIYRGRVGVEDADIIAELKDRGAILIGKTQTTAFAYMTPGPTRNPRNVEHTPGGSSSGSAAAVAAGMVPLALGTQTKGSVLRPASYCGVTGFKPTFGSFSMKGVLPFAKSLDTLGFFTHTPADMRALWRALGRDCDGAEVSVLGAPSPTPTVEAPMAAAESLLELTVT